MISDNERREVARRLRGISRDVKFWGGVDPLHYVKKGVFGDVDRHGPNETIDRLADLIEPGEPKVKCVAEVKVDGEQLEQLVHDATVELTGIDREALLALADEMGRVSSRCDFCIKNSGCDWADEIICLESHIDDYAQRIREALGASE